MSQIRILVAGLPGLLYDIVRELIERQDDMTIVGRAPGRCDLAEAVREARADVAILGCDEAELATVARRLRAGRPRLRILAIAGDGRSAVVAEADGARAVLEDVSPAGLVAGIRTAD